MKILLLEERSVKPEMVLWAGGSKLLATLLTNRGVESREEVTELLDPLSLPEPELGNYPPLVSAVKRIRQAIQGKELIAIYGDYDVDGITSTTVLVSGLRQLGGEVIWHIPNRFSEGYGMHPERVQKMADAGVKLIITCDCGISNPQEIALAKGLGMDVIITDHHTPPENLPDANAIVNFKQLPKGHPSRDLPGVGTAYILVRELLIKAKKDASYLLDMVALGVIADVVPLRGHSRQLYRLGLPILRKTQRPGLIALLQVSGVRPEFMDEEKIGFQIAPRINAAGRIADGSLAVKLFLAENPMEANQLAAELDSLNSQRKSLGGQITEEIDPEPGKPLVAYQPHWHQGVIGIAAGQVTSNNKTPCVLMTDSPDAKSIVGSARSLPGVNIYMALKDCSQFLDKYGGHPAAAGFSLSPENLEGFCQALTKRLSQDMVNWTPPDLVADLVLTPEEIRVEMVQELGKLAPYGEDNPRPLIYCKGLRVKNVRELKSGKGCFLTLGDRWRSFTAGLWNNQPIPDPGTGIGAIFTVNEDHYQSRPRVGATLEAWWPGQEKPEFWDIGPEYIDFRGSSWHDVLNSFPQASIFREGPGILDKVQGRVRNALEQSPTLVLLTAPASLGIFRQVVAMVNPQEIVLGFSPQEKRNFLQDLLATVKYSLTQDSVNLESMAATLGHTEDAVLAGLSLLAESDIIQYQLHQGELYIVKGNSTKFKGSNLLMEKLRKELEETNAFAQWLQRVEPEEIAKIRV